MWAADFFIHEIRRIDQQHRRLATEKMPALAQWLICTNSPNNNYNRHADK